MITKRDFESAQLRDAFVDILGQRWTVRVRTDRDGGVEFTTFNPRWGEIKLHWDDRKGGIVDEKEEIVEELRRPTARLRNYDA